MPIKAIIGEIEVETTHKCNWHCPYCAIKTHTLPEITDDELIKKIDGIPHGSNVTISGGEPGLLARPMVEYMLSKLIERDCILYLNTNGTFLERYPEYIDSFRQIMYHCSENLDNSDIIRYKNENIRYMIIVNDDNINKLDGFLSRFNDICFDIVAATYNNINDGVGLSNENRHLIAVRYFRHMTKESFQRLFHEKEWNKMKFI